VEHNPLEVLREATEFVFGLGVLDALQTKVKSFLRSVNGVRSGRSLTAGSLFGFCPSCLNSFSGAIAALCGSELGGSGGTAFFAAFAAESDCGGILLLYGYGDDCIIRERSGTDT
jgi:hypothetical protein